MASFCSTNPGTPEQKIAHLVLSRKWTALPEVNKRCQTSLKLKNSVYVSADTNSFWSFKISSNQQWGLAPPQAPQSVPHKLFMSTLDLPAYTLKKKKKKNKSHGGFLAQVLWFVLLCFHTILYSFSMRMFTVVKNVLEISFIKNIEIKANCAAW